MQLYDYIYSCEDVRHPQKGRLGPYGSHDNRDGLFLTWITNNVPKGSRVLDASCGRGHLMVSLSKLGYEVEGTEISGYLMKNDLARLRLPVRLLPYERYSEIDSDSFDCICSNDVLEHLIDEESAINALDNFRRISRRNICVSIGAKKRCKTYTVALRMTESGERMDEKARTRKPMKCRKSALELHRFVPGHKRWFELLNEVMNIDEKSIFTHAHQIFCCGTVKK